MIEQVKLLIQVIVKNSFHIQVQSYVGKTISLVILQAELVVGLLLWKMQAV